MSASYRLQEPVRYHQAAPTRSAYSSTPRTDNHSMKGRQRSVNANVVVTQPGRSVWDYEHPWSTTLCSCCSNCKQCCCAFFCPCCFECNLYKRAGENMCTCICPGSRYALRSKIRTAFRIQKPPPQDDQLQTFVLTRQDKMLKGSAIDDCCVSTCCPCCTSIQLTRELYYQGL